MKIKAAVLNAIGAKAPYAESKPLTIEEVELAAPGHGEVLVKIGAAGFVTPICRSSTATGRGRCRWRWDMKQRASSKQLGEGVTDLQARRSCRAGVRAQLRTLRPVRRRPPRAVRARRRRQRRGNAAFRRTAPQPQWRSHQPPPRLLGVRGIRHGIAAFGRQDRPGVAARRGGALWLCGTHGRRRGGQHGAGARGRVGRGDRAGRRRSRVAAGRAGSGRPAHRRDRPVGRETRSWRSRWAPRIPSMRATPTARNRFAN